MKNRQKELKLEYQEYKLEIITAIDKVLKSGRYVLGKEVERFETRFAEYIGTKYCVSCGSGFGALYLALKSLNKKGEYVNIINEQHVATTNAVKLAGMKPLYNASFAVTQATILVHSHRFDYNMDKYVDRTNILIEDACQSIPILLDDKRPGSFGLMGCFSFHPMKVLHCYGDGGAVTTNGKILMKRLKMLRDHGRDRNNNTYEFGINSRLDEIQATVLNIYLDQLCKK